MALLLSGGASLPPRMARLWERGELCDACVEVGSTPFHAHRLVLASSSDYFAALIVEGRFVDSSSARFSLPEMRAEAFRAVLKWMYYGEVSLSTGGLLLDVLQAAMRLQVLPLALAASRVMRKQLSPPTALVVWEHAEANGLSGLKQHALLLAAHHFSLVSDSEEWQRAPLPLALSLLRADRLAVESEQVVFEAATRWVLANQPGEREAASLLGCVRFALLPREFILERVLPNPCLQSGAAMRLVAEAGWGGAEEEVGQPRSGFDCAIYAVGGLDRAGSCLSSVQRFGLSEREWAEAPCMLAARSHAGVACVETLHACTLFAAGGFNGGESLASVERFRVGGEGWESVAPMRTPRYACGACVVDGLLYVAGGRNGDQVLHSVERFDPQSGEWEELPPMSHAREGCSVVSLDLALVVVGGFDGCSLLCSVERFHLQDGCWEDLPSMSAGRMGCGAAAINDALYVVGGYSEQDARGARLGSVNSAERYDTSRGTWEPLAPMKAQRMGCGVVTSGRSLYVVGGRSSGEVVESVEKYDTEAGTWQHETFLQPARSACGVVVSM